MEAHEVAFRILKRGDPTHTLSNFGLGHANRSSRLSHFLERRLNRFNRYVIHERLAGLFSSHEAAVNSFLTLPFGLHQKIIHLPRIAYLPSKSCFVEFLRALNIVCRNLKMNDRIWHDSNCVEFIQSMRLVVHPNAGRVLHGTHGAVITQVTASH